MRWMVAAVLVCSVGLAACDDKERPPGEVGMTSSQRYEPETLTIAAGDTVTWVNDSPEQHTVTAFEDDLPEGAGYFASGGAADEEEARAAVTEGLLGKGEDFQMTFEEPGVYRYFCVPHEAQGMTGTIVVE